MSESERLAKIDAVLPGRWDRDALIAGGSICLVMAIPFRVLAAAVGGDSGGLNALFFFLFLALFVVGSGSAAWVQRAGTPLTHAVTTAAVTFVIAEVVFVVVRVIRGTEIPWGGILLTFTMVVTAGLIGGFLGNRLQIRGFVPSTRR